MQWMRRFVWLGACLIVVAVIAYVVWAGRGDGDGDRGKTNEAVPSTPTGPLDDAAVRRLADELGIVSVQVLIAPVDEQVMEDRLARVPHDFKRILDRDVTQADLDRFRGEMRADWEDRRGKARALLQSYGDRKITREQLAAGTDELMMGAGEAFRRISGLTAEEYQKLTRSLEEEAQREGIR
jgi:hypothetical protein